eukprot:TRINITY_DN5174_c0_g1_i1.p1 TRINITY_DN5174_c0_g1~~TRINITY_DN5174_c0_g1_i1.p1  ORF type:complete len:369 (-),score=93.74 TRINITY_DN5174_c0_g1_i1:132-1238(-)
MLSELQMVVGQPCNTNKCGTCQRPDLKAPPMCVDQGSTLCPTDECVARSCLVLNSTEGGKTSYSYKCNETNLDGRACGAGLNLCLRSCQLGRCQDYDNQTVENRCNKAEAKTMFGCGECCEYQCEPKTGKCVVGWNIRLNTNCSDGFLCTVNDVCVANTNETSSNVTKLVCQGEPKCTPEKLGRNATGFPCAEFNCRESNFGECAEIPVNKNLTCPAEGFCGLEGKCNPSGECIRPRRPCISNNTCLIGRCREAEQKCEFLPELANGLPCDDKDNCTTNDICTNGTCNGTSVCNGTDSGGPNLAIPLGVTGAVVATGAAAAGFAVFKAMQSANLMDPVSWGEVQGAQFDSNPLYQENTRFGENPLFNT